MGRFFRAIAHPEKKFERPGPPGASPRSCALAAMFPFIAPRALVRAAVGRESVRSARAWGGDRPIWTGRREKNRTPVSYYSRVTLNFLCVR